jgi:type IV pilus assembly protein PilM
MHRGYAAMHLLFSFFAFHYIINTMFKKIFEFFPTPRFLKFSYVGLDIGIESLHYIEFTSNGKSLVLGRFGKRAFEKGDSILTNESLKNTLKEIRKSDNVRYAKVSLPEEETYLFTTEVTGDTESEIKEFIEFHLEENVPILGSESLFDYYLLPKLDNKNIAVVSVVSREVVNRYTSLLEECGITPVSFMVESGALSRAVVSKNYTGTHLLVYLSREKTMIAVVEDGFVQFSSTSNFGGGELTSAIQKQFGVDIEEARRIKYSDGLLKSTGDGENFSYVLANAISVLRDEIQRVSLYWLKLPQGSGHPVEKIILCGKDAAIPGFSEYIANSLKLPVEISNVWGNIDHYNNFVPEINFEDSLSYATAIGLVISSRM